LYAPDSFVIVVLVTLVSVLTTVTETPGRRAALGSVTTPPSCALPCENKTVVSVTTENAAKSSFLIMNPRKS